MFYLVKQLEPGSRTFVDVVDDEGELVVYPNAEEGKIHAENYTRWNNVKYQLRPLQLTSEQKQRWRQRENLRQFSRSLPFVRFDWWWSYRNDKSTDHYVHVSSRNPGLLAYTQNEWKGYKDIQTRIGPGTYLKQFFGHRIDDECIRDSVIRYTESFDNNHQLKFTDDPDEIERVY